MRELKFRAQSLNGDLIYFGLYDIGAIYSDDSVFYIKGIPCRMGTEEQFTDRKDSKGKEVYEGDLVKFYDKDMRVRIEQVYWATGAFWVNGIGDKLQIEDTRIVGNSTENPEMLRKISY